MRKLLLGVPLDQQRNDVTNRGSIEPVPCRTDHCADVVVRNPHPNHQPPRLHVVLTTAGAQRDLTAERVAELLRGIRPRDTAGKTLRGLAADLISEIRQLDRRIAKAAADIQTAVTDSGTTLTELCGVGA